MSFIDIFSIVLSNELVEDTIQTYSSPQYEVVKENGISSCANTKLSQSIYGSSLCGGVTESFIVGAVPGVV